MSNLLYLFRALESGEHVLSRGSVDILSPVTEPQKVICVGMNYVDHCEEQNVAIPLKPLIFSKFASAITHPGAPIYLPSFTKVCIRMIFACPTIIINHFYLELLNIYCLFVPSFTHLSVCMVLLENYLSYTEFSLN